jgi:hypothetical protein
MAKFARQAARQDLADRVGLDLRVGCQWIGRRLAQSAELRRGAADHHRAACEARSVGRAAKHVDRRYRARGMSVQADRQQAQQSVRRQRQPGFAHDEQGRFGLQGIVRDVARKARGLECEPGQQALAGADKERHAADHTIGVGR